MYGVTLIHKVRNTDIRDALKTGELTDVIDHRRRKYLGHICRYPDERIVKRLLGTTWNAAGNKRGNTKTWISMVRKCLKDRDLDVQVDKNTWRHDVEKLHTRE